MKKVCPICKNLINDKKLAEHICAIHSEEEFKRIVLKAKECGISDPKIGELFGITFRQLEKIITEAYGINISVLKKPKKIKYWVPKDFKEETTTVWSYKQRGDWATHDGRYRGNWSPYIPRNVILKYSKPGDIVLDYFVGGGTTAIEAKLLGRKCIARDINPACIELTKENLKFIPPQDLLQDESFTIYEPEVSIGDARDLSNIKRDYPRGVDLICAHPPYAGIINYSSKVEGDLSKLSINDFLKEMEKVASESYQVLKPGRKCAILIGDTRKKKHVVPIGFKTIDVFLNQGFKLKELVIKRQHNCKTTGFWYDRSIKYNFLLLAHEYLPIFEKPTSNQNKHLLREEYNRDVDTLEIETIYPQINDDCPLESTCVWVFPYNVLTQLEDSNVIRRYSKNRNFLALSFSFGKSTGRKAFHGFGKEKDLLYVKAPFLSDVYSIGFVKTYLSDLKNLINEGINFVNNKGFIVIQTRDVRIDGYIKPLAKDIIDIFEKNKDIWLKEIVVVTTNNRNSVQEGGLLEITHHYLLVYERL